LKLEKILYLFVLWSRVLVSKWPLFTAFKKPMTARLMQMTHNILGAHTLGDLLAENRMQ